MGSSRTRARTRIPCIGRRILPRPPGKPTEAFWIPRTPRRERASCSSRYQSSDGFAWTPGNLQKKKIRELDRDISFKHQNRVQSNLWPTCPCPTQHPPEEQGAGKSGRLGFRQCARCLRLPSSILLRPGPPVRTEQWETRGHDSCQRPWQPGTDRGWVPSPHSRR